MLCSECCQIFVSGRWYVALWLRRRRRRAKEIEKHLDVASIAARCSTRTWQHLEARRCQKQREECRRHQCVSTLTTRDAVSISRDTEAQRSRRGFSAVARDSHREAEYRYVWTNPEIMRWVSRGCMPPPPQVGPRGSGVLAFGWPWSGLVGWVGVPLRYYLT